MKTIRIGRVESFGTNRKRMFDKATGRKMIAIHGPMRGVKKISGKLKEIDSSFTDLGQGKRVGGTYGPPNVEVRSDHSR